MCHCLQSPAVIRRMVCAQFLPTPCTIVAHHARGSPGTFSNPMSCNESATRRDLRQIAMISTSQVSVSSISTSTWAEWLLGEACDLGELYEKSMGMTGGEGHCAQTAELSCGMQCGGACSFSVAPAAACGDEQASTCRDGECQSVCLSVVICRRR